MWFVVTLSLPDQQTGLPFHSVFRNTFQYWGTAGILRINSGQAGSGCDNQSNSYTKASSKGCATGKSTGTCVVLWM
jgi:hypothetical protein